MADLLRFELVAFRTALQLSWADEALETDVRLALDYVHAHLFDDDLSVGRVRERCGLRNNNVTFRFKAAVGAGIRDYIETMRIEMAKRVLRFRHHSVTQIALETGFRSPETFARAFRRATGLSPTEFRYRLGSSME